LRPVPPNAPNAADLLHAENMTRGGGVHVDSDKSTQYFPRFTGK
jgi:hypothetical protein